MSSIRVQLDEVMTVRDAMRTMPTLVQALNQGRMEKCVLMKRGQMAAVILDVEAYAQLVEKANADGP